MQRQCESSIHVCNKNVKIFNFLAPLCSLKVACVENFAAMLSFLLKQKHREEGVFRLYL